MTRDIDPWLALTAENARLRIERDDVWADRNRLEVEVVTMRPVVESAEAWAEVECTRSDATLDSSIWLEAHKARTAAVLAAVDAWRAAQVDQKGPSDGLSASVGDEPTYAHGPDCNTVHDGPEKCPPPKPAPADPAGLDAATEAAAEAVCDDWGSIPWSEANPARRGIYRRSASAIVRAAAPHIRRAVLLEAAADVKANMQMPLWLEKWLRERAERETTGG